MGRQEEQKCFNHVKSYLSSIASNDEYGPQIKNKDSFFGLELDDVSVIVDCFQQAEHNPKDRFPDYIFEDGFLEHFLISSAPENAGGSRHKKTHAQFLKEKKPETTPGMAVFCYGEHSYENLSQSFRSHWEHHIDGLNGWLIDRDIPQHGVFVVEYNEAALHMSLGFPEYRGTIGDLAVGPWTHSYRLSRDKQLLEYLFGFAGQVEFVIFVYHPMSSLLGSSEESRSEGNGIEIIKLANIPPITQFLEPLKCCVMSAGGTREVHRTEVVEIATEAENASYLFSGEKT